MFKAFVTLFSEADWLFYILFITSILVPVLDLFFKTKGLATVGGVMLTFATVAERCADGDNSANELLGYIFYIPLIVFLVSLGIRKIIIEIKKKTQVKYTVIDGNKIPLTKDGFLDYSFLIGETGLVVTDLKPTGKVRFDKGTFEVTSLKEYIYSGSMVEAEKLLNGKIIVKKSKD